MKCKRMLCEEQLAVVVPLSAHGSFIVTHNHRPLGASAMT